ncbi:MAG: cobalamin biosynthesis protein CobD [Deltaproteobacteria bacterium]|nr:cobalamin biosynthesis protein CobD [Deltaproteobacteria bacterium]
MNVPANLEPSLVALAAAVCLDLAFGEPTSRLHPVVWMGTLTSALQRLAPGSGAIRQLAFGGLIAGAVPLTFSVTSSAIVAGFGQGSMIGLALSAFLLKTTFSLCGLGKAAAVVRDALERGDLGGGRHGLRALCSRDPTRLGEPALVAATVESVAENASDSFVAPLFYYGLFGLPGAIFYRAVNTLDAMIGYHGRFEYLGKAAARLDDVLNLVPARLTAVLLLAAAPLVRKDARRGWLILRRDGFKTESPNAGRPMAAMAGLLGVELEKEGHYTLGDPIEPLAVSKIDEAWHLVRLAAVFAVVCCAALLGARHACAR